GARDGEYPVGICYWAGKVCSVGPEADLSRCVFVERAAEPGEISRRLREYRHVPAGNSSNADGLSQAAAHVLHRLATTTEGGVCRMAEAKYIGRRQEAVCPQAEIAVLVGEDQESTILVADERYVIMKDILSCPNAYEECHVVVQCVFEEPPVGLRFQEWEVGSADAAQTVAQWLEPHMSR
ncbi:hypothetical protein TGVAND_365150, partial [Toxoplasma gondii VAND]